MALVLTLFHRLAWGRLVNLRALFPQPHLASRKTCLSVNHLLKEGILTWYLT